MREGLAYCFLPLPVHTNLPVMVNGFFELSSNRRDVWQGGSDMTGDGRTRAEWNIRFEGNGFMLGQLCYLSVCSVFRVTSEHPDRAQSS